MQDEELIELLTGGDEGLAEKAFNVVYDRYKASAIRAAAYITKDAEDAADVVQDVFADLWQKRAKKEIDGNLGAYLNRAAQHRAMNMLNSGIKRKKRHFHHEEKYGMLSDQMLRQEKLKQLIEAVDKIAPEPYANAFKDSNIYGEEDQDVADKYNIPLRRVRYLTSKLTAKLRSIFNPK
ncbi:RNA polymerase sigma factor [Chitinophaga pinensis]|uniref:RNA polymerase, sigma-24 subunit, ECF subfamily n=1 Tax=Chitinophaga pinensis (strain ATCC 43595 / DSM 2588 / LMG 13176 / NBRC 15968 / NCIMB 11800 / UQM 2034) TaxID=485918 RepID=A0A979G493_CHIPD|nr:sigma-70 family RNA polymerase sigma factor [Chitinophaga pinensis]ACU60672.1 RNA polymerase, sigma-24 subunit, ECF subfamily [Chitinophaga pinensis DSM 2588]